MVAARGCFREVNHPGSDGGSALTVWSSDGKRTRGHLGKQGPPVLRWALYEAAVYSARPTSPDYAYYRNLNRRRASGASPRSRATVP